MPCMVLQLQQARLCPQYACFTLNQPFCVFTVLPRRTDCLGSRIWMLAPPILNVGWPVP